MSEVVFNINDLVLVMTAIMSGMLALFLAVFRSNAKGVSNYLLVGFMLLYVIIPIDKLITYGESFRAAVLTISPNLFLLGEIALFLEGPILFWYAKSLVYKEFRFRRSDLLHLIPLAIYLVYAYTMFYRFDAAYKVELISTLKVFEHWSFKYFFVFRDWTRVFYSVLALSVVLEYRAEIRERFSQLERIDMNWLLSLVVGFMILRIWMFLESLGSMTYLLIQGDATETYITVMSASGLMVGYYIFILMFTMIFFSLSYSPVFEGVEGSKSEDRRPNGFDSDLVSRLKEMMETDKPHLKHHITLEALADKLNVSPRVLSAMLNRSFGKNFFEFINDYRVQEAKRLLSDPAWADQPMVEIFGEAGFSSKSAFNNFFKRIEGITPREFRLKQQENVKKADS